MTSPGEIKSHIVFSSLETQESFGGLRAELASKISDLSVEIFDEAERRSKIVDLFREALNCGRLCARRYLESGKRDVHCAQLLSELQDQLIGAIYDYVISYVHVADNPTFAERLAIVAVGGYGRGRLAPGSDIDLLFLLPYKQTPWGESVVEAILYILWDLRQKVGHATRSVAECMRQMRSDMTIRTTLLEARFILGNRELFSQLQESFDREIARMDAREFVAAKLLERDGRVRRAGASRYLVEPNVKDGKGGLRDLNTLFWIAKYVYRVREPKDLVAAGLFTQAEYRQFQTCEDYLWNVRCYLHFARGRADERLTFDIQPLLAERLGYHNRSGLSSVERFMKHYFLVAKQVGDLTAIVCAALEERQAKPRAIFDRFLQPFRRRRSKTPQGDFIIATDRISIVDENAFLRNPVNIIRLFWLADHHGLPLHPDALRAVTRSLRAIDSSLRENKEANRLFLEILLSRNMTESVLRRMNETGVLGRFIPEFGRIVAMMQFNMYHHYTVDEHLLRAVGALCDFEAGRASKSHAPIAEVMPTVVNRKVLYLGLFLHDIAKGRKEDHSIAGMMVARTLCPRLGFTPGETETVAWLVEHHLTMSTYAQSRDISDPATIDSFAAIVQTMERLKLLFVLTLCDISAVGPGVLDAWKAQLLLALYWETEIVLGGGHSAVDRKSRVAASISELRAALPHWSDAEFLQYEKRHYPAYWLKVDLTRKIRHGELLRSLDGAKDPLITDIILDKKRDVVELTVIAPDHRRLLSTIAGCCAVGGANIVDAHIFTTADGLALDTIFFSRGLGFDEDELRRAERIAEMIVRALRGEAVIADAVKARATTHPPVAEFPVAPEVTVDNSLSNTYTVVEVSGLDREGLLFDLTNAISKLNLNIASAHVTTFGERAVDAFYVTDLTGAKIVSPQRQIAIKRQLLDVFEIRHLNAYKKQESTPAA